MGVSFHAAVHVVAETVLDSALHSPPKCLTRLPMKASRRITKVMDVFINVIPQDD
jgi:hypothetical protein